METLKLKTPRKPRTPKDGVIPAQPQPEFTSDNLTPPTIEIPNKEPVPMNTSLKDAIESTLVKPTITSSMGNPFDALEGMHSDEAVPLLKVLGNTCGFRCVAAAERVLRGQQYKARDIQSIDEIMQSREYWASSLDLRNEEDSDSAPPPPVGLEEIRQPEMDMFDYYKVYVKATEELASRDHRPRDEIMTLQEIVEFKRSSPQRMSRGFTNAKGEYVPGELDNFAADLGWTLAEAEEYENASDKIKLQRYSSMVPNILALIRGCERSSFVTTGGGGGYWSLDTAWDELPAVDQHQVLVHVRDKLETACAREALNSRKYGLGLSAVANVRFLKNVWEHVKLLLRNLERQFKSELKAADATRGLRW